MSDNLQITKNKYSVVELHQKIQNSFSKHIFKLAKLDAGLKEMFEILTQLKINDPKKMILVMKDTFEKYIYAQVEKQAVAAYLLMKKTNKWTEAGSQRVDSSFMQVILKIPSDQEGSFSDYEKFNSRITELINLYKLEAYSVQELKKLVDVPKIYLLGRSFDIFQAKDLNKILSLVGSRKRLLMGLSGSGKTIIFGSALSVKFSCYDVHYVYFEDIRTPNCVNYMVALIEHKQIGIRRSACDYVFFNKWLPVLDDSDFLYNFNYQDQANAISDALKKRLVSEFGVAERDEFIKQKNDFINIMMENLTYHEIAHDVLEEVGINPTEMAVHNGIANKKETILSVLNEMITEWMPNTHNCKGPLKNIIDTAFERNDTVRANKMTYMYLSDGWFLDTDTKFMYSYTYIMFVIYLNYFNQDGSINYHNLYNDFNDIFQWLKGEFVLILSEVRSYLRKQSFLNLEGKSMTFLDLENLTTSIYNVFNKMEEVELTEKQKLNDVWINCLHKIEETAPELLSGLINFICSLEKDFYSKLMKKFASQDNVEKYGNDVNSYVLDKMSLIFNSEK